MTRVDTRVAAELPAGDKPEPSPHDPKHGSYFLGPATGADDRLRQHAAKADAALAYIAGRLKKWKPSL